MYRFFLDLLSLAVFIMAGACFVLFLYLLTICME
jgi:hypothetical protein